MSTKTLRMADDIRELLETSGVPWRLEGGSKHVKIYVGDRLATVAPRSGRKSESLRYGGKNSLASVRRAIRDYHKKHGCKFDTTGEYSCSGSPCIRCHGEQRCT